MVFSRPLLTFVGVLKVYLWLDMRLWSMHVRKRCAHELLTIENSVRKDGSNARLCVIFTLTHVRAYARMCVRTYKLTHILRTPYAHLTHACVRMCVRSPPYARPYAQDLSLAHIRHHPHNRNPAIPGHCTAHVINQHGKNIPSNSCFCWKSVCQVSS